MILKCSKSRKQIVLSGNVSDLGDIFLMTSRTMKAEFSGRGVLRVEQFTHYFGLEGLLRGGVH